MLLKEDTYFSPSNGFIQSRLHNYKVKSSYNATFPRMTIIEKWMSKNKQINIYFKLFRGVYACYVDNALFEGQAIIAKAI